MAAGLFDSPPRVAAAPAPEAAEPEGYRSLSGVAVAALAVAALGPVAFVDWWLAAVPAVGLVLAGVALRDLAARPDVLTGRGLALAAAGLSAACLSGGLAYRTVVYRAELPPGHVRLGYALLQPAQGDPPLAVPETARAVNGRDVLLKGFMYPGKQQRGIVQFLLVRDQGDCCFGGNPKITDRVLVQLADAGGVEFTPRIVKVAGRFRVEPAGAPELGGGVLYHLDQARVR
jgi:hypothetical protein